MKCHWGAPVLHPPRDRAISVRRSKFALDTRPATTPCHTVWASLDDATRSAVVWLLLILPYSIPFDSGESTYYCCPHMFSEKYSSFCHVCLLFRDRFAFSDVSGSNGLVVRRAKEEKIDLGKVHNTDKWEIITPLLNVLDKCPTSKQTSAWVFCFVFNRFGNFSLLDVSVELYKQHRVHLCPSSLLHTAVVITDAARCCGDVRHRLWRETGSGQASADRCGMVSAYPE